MANHSPANTGRKGEHLHDAMAKTYFGNPQNMANFLEQCLPATVYKKLDPGSLKPSSESYVDEELKKHIADLVFTCKTRDGRDGSVYVLFEHKSQPALTCAVQMLRYMVCIWHRALINGVFEKTGLLPFVIPVVFYHGKQKWNGRQLLDLFGDDTDLQAYVPDFSMIVYSLKDIPRKILERKPEENAMLIFLQDLLQNDPEKRICNTILMYASITQSGNKNMILVEDAIDIFFTYIDSAFPQIAGNVKKHLEEHLMNANTLNIDRVALTKSWFPWLYEDAVHKGRDEAKASAIQTQRTTIVQLLQARFGDVPQSILSDLQKISDSAMLARLTVAAGTAPTLDNVASAIRKA